MKRLRLRPGIARYCAECRHARFMDFCTAWRATKPGKGKSQRPKARSAIDDQLHSERVASDRSKRSFLAALDELPDTVFVTVPTWGEEAYMVWGDHLLAWSPGGYGDERPRPKGKEVRVLTPKSTVAVIRAGYVPEVHSVSEASSSSHPQSLALRESQSACCNPPLRLGEPNGKGQIPARFEELGLTPACVFLWNLRCRWWMATTSFFLRAN